MTRFEGHWSKIIRAEEHLAAARAEFDFYREGDVCRLVGQFNDDETEYVVRLENIHPPSARLAILIGDCVTNLRSSLDHLIYTAIAKHDPERLVGRGDRSVHYPINLSCITKKGKRPVDYSSLEGLPEAARALIKSQQPCCRGEEAAWHPLSLVHEMSIADKHRNLLLTTVYIYSGALGIRNRRFHPLVIRGNYLTGEFKAGAEMIRWPLTPAELRDNWSCRGIEDVEVYGYAPLQIAFDEPDPPLDRPVFEVLDNCIEFVRTLVGKIAQACGFF